MSNSAIPWTAACQVSLSITKAPRVHSDSCPLSWWCHPTILSSVAPFPSSCPHSFPVSGSFKMSQLFTWGGPSIWVLASASVFPMNIQGSFSLGRTAMIFMFMCMYVCMCVCVCMYVYIYIYIYIYMTEKQNRQGQQLRSLVMHQIEKSYMGKKNYFPIFKC